MCKGWLRYYRKKNIRIHNHENEMIMFYATMDLLLIKPQQSFMTCQIVSDDVDAVVNVNSSKI